MNNTELQQRVNALEFNRQEEDFFLLSKKIKQMSESDIKNNIRKALEHVPGLILWNNAVGLAKIGGRFIRYGLQRGSSDLIGIYRLTIRPEHVGKTIGVFVAGETKIPKGREAEHQTAFRESILAHGGIAGVWRNVDDALRTLRLK